MPLRPGLEYDSAEIDDGRPPFAWRFIIIALVIGGIAWYVVTH
jgi:hypothetical protein